MKKVFKAYNLNRKKSIPESLDTNKENWKWNVTKPAMKFFIGVFHSECMVIIISRTLTFPFILFHIHNSWNWASHFDESIFGVWCRYPKNCSQSVFIISRNNHGFIKKKTKFSKKGVVRKLNDKERRTKFD